MFATNLIFHIIFVFKSKLWYFICIIYPNRYIYLSKWLIYLNMLRFIILEYEHNIDVLIIFWCYLWNHSSLYSFNTLEKIFFKRYIAFLTLFHTGFWNEIIAWGGGRLDPPLVSRPLFKLKGWKLVWR